MDGRREAALRGQAELLERGVPARLLDAPLQLVLRLEGSALRRDEAEHDLLRSRRQEAQRLEASRALVVPLHEEAVHVELAPEQKEGFTRYFANADRLTVAVSDVDVLVEGDEALVTFTRRDAFKDHSSGKDMQLEVRLSSVVVNDDGRWLMRGVKRSS